MMVAWSLLIALMLTAPTAAAVPDEELAGLAKQLKHKDAKVRLKAAESIRDKGKDAEPITREICDALFDPNPEVVGVCLGSLKTINAELYKPLNVLVTEDGYIRTKFFVAVNSNWDKAIEEITELGPVARPAAGVLVAKIKQDLASGYAEDTGRLGKFGDALVAVEPDDAATIAFLKPFAASVGKRNRFRLSALEVVAKWASKDEKRDKEYLPILKFHMTTKDGLSLAAIALSEQLGARAAPLLPELKKLKNSTNETVREAATKAVESIEKP